jgi:hypothetical protein
MYHLILLWTLSIDEVYWRHKIQSLSDYYLPKQHYPTGICMETQSVFLGVLTKPFKTVGTNTQTKSMYFKV